MKTALILHGIGSRAGDNWIQWLFDELVRLGYKAIMPTLPDTNHPIREKWLKTVEDLVKDANFKNLTLIRSPNIGRRVFLDNKPIK
jgi:hypothetical protein